MPKTPGKRYSELGLETTERILPRWVASKGKMFSRQFLEHSLYWHWPAIVGETLARQLAPMGIRKDTLHLYGPNSVLNYQVRLMESELVQKVNAYAGRPLIKHIYVGRRWEHPDTTGQEAVHRELLAQAATPQTDLGREIRQTNLSGAEMTQAARLAAHVEDDDLQQAIQKAYQHHLQAQHVKRQHDWTPCVDCGTLCPPADKYCQRCAAQHNEKLHNAIAAVLRDIPWARFQEVQHYVPAATPALVSAVRQSLVQELAAKTDVRDHQSMQAKTLAMLYRCLPPDKLTPEAIDRALYRLRFDMYIPQGYQIPRRYTVIPWGKKQKKTNNK